MFALLVMPLLTASLFGQMLGSMGSLSGLLWTATVVAAMMLAVLLICFVCGVRDSRVVSWAFQQLPLGTFVRRIVDTVQAYRHNVGTLLAAVGLSLVVHTFMIGATLLLVQATTPVEASCAMAMLIPLGFMANALPLTPGGLGIGEAAFSELFARAGLTGGAEALLGWRILMMLIGLLGLVFYLQGSKHFIGAQSLPPHQEEIQLRVVQGPLEYSTSLVVPR